MSNDLHANDPRGAFFDERAAAWEEKCYPPEARARLLDLLPYFGVRPGATALDLGAGTGVLAPYLREILAGGMLLSLDLSFEMARHAAMKDPCGKGGVLQATAMRLPVRDSSIDVVVCFAAFPHFEDKLEALKEMFRALKPGGNVVVAHLLSREELSRHHGGCSAVADDKLPDDDGMRELFLAAGFPEPEIIDMPGRYVARAAKERT
ncbi:MAG: methyltransferase domain-containing protein [Deltaproteobacteria bacterium]|jgi:ubiquinone/menaquinone biosynthesis C-methylase UbiE|nr:methyltransferase domain-containing protein [Deltaproteobacteria bacterium]